MTPSFTPTVPLNEGETVQVSFSSDRMTYWREMAWVSVVAMVVGMAVLWFMGNPHVWTGAVGGLAAIAVRAFYLASDELKVRWDLTNQRLLGPNMRITSLNEITAVRPFLSAVQVVTSTGDKHLIKYQADRESVVRAIERAIAA
ncbi:hypothetical protein Q4555_07660 [Octadecabacter sp. 1_MG-2023]|nr:MULTISPECIES: hypothetical protein [unclassified Octadecabacter]MBU2994171.1 hypothetical protein [Octadecabacter sp. B2R22]MDO6734540.1 hypothetical protein [Octadecabacter sp. 1_MG-2023]